MITRREKGEARIIEAAGHVFARKGYRAATLRDIAAAADMSQRRVRHFFPTMDDLLQAVLADWDKQASAIVERLTDRDEILEYTRSVTDELMSPEGIGDLMIRMSVEAADPEHPARAFVRRRNARLAAELTQLLERAQDAGLLREGVDPDRAAQTFFALRDGAQLHRLLGIPGVVDVPDLVVEYQRSLFR